MSKSFLAKGRLRAQVIKILVVSFLLSTFFLIAGLLFINYVVIGNDQELMQQLYERVNVYAQEASQQIAVGIEEVDEISQWEGWEKLPSMWHIEVYSSENELLYAKGMANTRYDSIISVVQPIKGMDGAYIQVITGTNQGRIIFQGIFFLLSIAMFAVLFSIQFRRIEKYTYEIADGISILAGGELDFRLPVHGKDELSMLAAHINEMAHSLKLKNEEKRKSDAARDDLITNVAHDIRTPITVLEGYLSMLVSEQDMAESKRREYMRISLDKCIELSDRANNIFEIVRLNSDSEHLKTETVNARGYIAQRIEEMAMVLGGESIAYSADVRISDAQTIDIDKSKAQRVFDNLLSNILKYADATQPVEMCAEVHGQHIVVRIRNTMREPLGIDPEQLFDRMASGDKSRSGKSAGLGLSICKVIMRMHGGNIEASIPDDTITFTLQFLKND